MLGGGLGQPALGVAIASARVSDASRVASDTIRSAAASALARISAAASRGRGEHPGGLLAEDLEQHRLVGPVRASPEVPHGRDHLDHRLIPS